MSDTLTCTELSRDEPLLHDLNTDAVEAWGLIPSVSCHTVLKIRHKYFGRESESQALKHSWLMEKCGEDASHQLIGFFRGRAPAVPPDHTPALLPPSRSHFLCVAWQEISQVIRQPAASSLLLIGWRKMCHPAKKTSCWSKKVLLWIYIVLLSGENVTKCQCACQTAPLGKK